MDTIFDGEWSAWNCEACGLAPRMCLFPSTCYWLLLGGLDQAPDVSETAKTVVGHAAR